MTIEEDETIYQRWIEWAKTQTDEDVKRFLEGPIEIKTLETHPNDPFLQRLNRDFMAALDDIEKKRRAEHEDSSGG
jgi:hypothetical protein